MKILELISTETQNSLSISAGQIRFGLKRFMKAIIASFAVVVLASGASAQETPTLGTRLVVAARKQIGVTKEYDPAYVALKYPGGDVPLRTGVCSDVVVRALRQVGIDLQKEVHEDMRRDFSAYPQKWGLRGPDKNIDHRRVPNLMRYFERHHTALREQLTPPDSYQPGDIVAWDLGNGMMHIGIVSDRKTGRTPLIIHNIGSGAKEEDILLRYRVIGHYRVKGNAPRERPEKARQPVGWQTNQTSR